MKKFTLRDVADAIEKNGLPQIGGNLFLFSSEEDGYPDNSYADDKAVDLKVIGACALGMACINLGVKETDYWDFSAEYFPKLEELILSQIPNWNDDKKLSFKQIAARIRAYKTLLDIELEAPEYKYIV